MTLDKLIDYRNQYPHLWLPRNRTEFERRGITTYELLVNCGFIDQLKTKSDISVILRTGGTSSLAYKILPSSFHRFKYNDRAVSTELLFDVIKHQWPLFAVQLLHDKVAFLPGNIFESGDVPIRYVSNALVSEKWWLWERVCPVPQEIFDGVWLYETSEQKLSAIALCYGGRNPAVVSWVPWVILQFAQEWKKLYDQPLCPQVVIVWWCAIDPYVQQIRQALWDDVLIIPYYNATEGTFGYQPRELRNSDDYETLQLKHDCGIWYELVDIQWQIINLSQACLDVKYILLVTTYDGLCRYELGDIIEFIDVEQSWIRIVGRTSEYIDIANEHTQIQHVQRTVSQLREYCDIWHYCVFPSLNGGVRHYVVVYESSWHWDTKWKELKLDTVFLPDSLLRVPSSDSSFINETSVLQMAEKFDEILWIQNCNYAAKRSGGTLWPVRAKMVAQWWFDDLIAQLNHERQSTQSKLLTLYPKEDNPVSNKIIL